MIEVLVADHPVEYAGMSLIISHRDLVEEDGSRGEVYSMGEAVTGAEEPYT